MTVLRFIVFMLYTLAGLSAFIAFAYYKNYGASLLAVLTGITNGVLSFLHYLNIRNRLHHFYTVSNLHQIGRLGLVIFIFASMCLVYYSVIEILLKKAILPIEDSVILPIIWALILLKSGLMLLYYSKYYANEDHDLLLISGEVENSSENTSRNDEKEDF